MTIGIYALYWKEQDLIYIGQSVNIEKRYINHLSDLKLNKHCNFKLSNTYNMYGVPVLFILEVCQVSLLDEQEAYWIEDFNSIDRGLNITGAGSARGLQHSQSKYSKFLVLKAFVVLTSKEESIKILSTKYRIPESLLRHISAKETHFWLYEDFPERSKLLTKYAQIRRHSNHNSLVTPRVYISPEGKEYKVTNLRQFANCII